MFFWDRRLKKLEIEKLRLESKKLQIEIKELQKKTSSIYRPTTEEIERYGQKLLESTNQNKTKLFDLLVGKSIDDVRKQFDLWIEMLKTGGEKTEEIFNAFESLAKSAQEKRIKLEVEMMTHLISYKETITAEETSITMQMSEEMVLYFIQHLDKLINTDRIDEHNIAFQTEQLGYDCLLRSTTGASIEELGSTDDMNVE